MISYKDAGVNIDKAEELVKTLDFSDFASLYTISKSLKNPVLLTTSDGVGTKALLVETEDDYRMIAIDLFAANANDILTRGVKLSGFLDYIAVPKLNLTNLKVFLKTIQSLCDKYTCKLLGGETAELPDTYKYRAKEFVGFGVAIVDKEELIDPSTVKEGDLVLGIASNGFHANGYSLLRYLLFKKHKLSLESLWPNTDKTIRSVLLKETKVYIDTLAHLKPFFKVKAMANITGGGIQHNLKRVLPKDLSAKLYIKTEEDFIYQSLLKLGLSIDEIKRVFNLGIGFVIVVSRESYEKNKHVLENIKDKIYMLGEIIKGDGELRFLE